MYIVVVAHIPFIRVKRYRLRKFCTLAYLTVYNYAVLLLRRLMGSTDQADPSFSTSFFSSPPIFAGPRSFEHKNSDPKIKFLMKK